MARAVVLSAVFCLTAGAAALRAQDDFEKSPIDYSRAAAENLVSRLQERLERGELQLEFDDAHGYLPSLLKSMNVPVESQMLVFSKTSMQRARITPETPRAVYFNDEAYVGYCHQGGVLEIAAADPVLGAAFYTLDQTKAEKPAIIRKTQDCLICHSITRDISIPGFVVRSVFTDSDGLPILSEGGFRVDHSTPIEDRWGGWYVTGTHGAQPHLGNLIVRKTPVRRPVLNPEGQNLSKLDGRFPVGNYLAPHSDLVALMVFEHQAMLHNLITQANFAARQALHYEAELNEALGDPPGYRRESTTRRIADAGDRLVKGLLFVDEAPIASKIAGTSGFAGSFSAVGPRDRRGRSLREFDLSKRMFRYPCSYLIYSPQFDALHPEMRSYVAERLRAVLLNSDDGGEKTQGKEQLNAFKHLSPEDRLAIWEILNETKPALFAQATPQVN
ncbi:MAG: hypothetical protein AB7O26_21095 [Planctomycetaceae bacterium]